MKFLLLRQKGPRELSGLRLEEESGILGVVVKCVDIEKNTSGEGGSLF